ncbi:MAG: hypothetical protein ABIN97_09130 [Ginsengibacter sp.]
MKKTTTIFRNIIAIAAITIFISCKKEIERPENDLNSANKVAPSSQLADSLTMARSITKPPSGPGYGTQQDTTNARSLTMARSTTKPSSGPGSGTLQDTTKLIR